MWQGRSGAGVVGVDLSGKTGELDSGVYVLRVGPADDRQTEPNEIAAHDLLRATAPAFAEAHLPRLLRIHSTGRDAERLVVTLYEVAGGGLHQYVSSRTRSTGLRQTACRLSEELLTAWSDPSDIGLLTPYDLLVDLVGQDRVAECLDVVEAFIPVGNKVVHDSGHAFLDPREILSPGRVEPVRVMRGHCHGDLNTENLLVPVDERADTDSGYWIVDLARARTGAVGFDLAYLEVSVLVNLIMPDMSPSTLARCLDSAEDTVRRSVPDDTDWLMRFLEESRKGIRAWISTQPGRVDQLSAQFQLVRMIAGLLWALRFSRDSEKARICVAYAGWYALRYARTVGIDDSTSKDTGAGGAELRLHEEAEEKLWEALWATASGFAPHSARYALIAGRMPHADSVAALGRIPWSVIVDLDPKSDGDGLRAVAGPVLDVERSVHLVTRDQPLVDYDRGTAWMLAAGSVQRDELPDDLRTWGYKRLGGVRQLAQSFWEAIGDTPVFVVVLEGDGDGDEPDGTQRGRLLKVVEAMDEMLQGHGTFLHVGRSALAGSAETTLFPLPLSAFLARLTETLGASPRQSDYTIPAIGRSTAAISPETMQKLREHLVVLHDTLELTVSPAGGVYDDEFWRGGLISWADLDMGRDVARTVTENLLKILRENLEQHRNRTVLLHHRPGTGGTTVALRAAWDLHHEYPVAVLPHGAPVDRARVPLIADRLYLLHSRTQAPVLLVAESGDLSESDREALYQELAKRGVRVTLLYVRRGAGVATGGALQLAEFLDKKETKDFGDHYSELVVAPSRKDELRMLSRGQYEKYRTPFFYGLVTFERKFTKLGDYVSAHLEKAGERVGNVMVHLALVTIFSNTGLQRELVIKLMGQSDLDLELVDVLGPEAARLVAVRSGRVRLQHQLIAEQVLVRILGDENWIHYLKQRSIDFIEAIARTTEVSSEPVRVLLRQMFVERQGGGTVEGVEDRGNFAPLIERLNENSAHEVLKSLTQHVPDEPHFWTHLGRHQMYRLDREYDKAEEYVAKAVALAKHDFIHHHTLGLTRRGILRQEMKKVKGHGVAAVMRVVEERYQRTVECFETSRELNPDNLHGYISHVQTIITVAETFRVEARVKSIAELETVAGDWVQGKVSEAIGLLHEATQAYGTLDGQDTYLVRCHADIRKLHGDLDAVVETWEQAAIGRSSSPMVQRALAQAYFLRGERRWTNLGKKELRRIVYLAQRNLSRHDCREDDYRLWFEAYKLLPEFDIDEALSQLELWSERFPSWRAHYYRFCLFFHLWLDRRSDSAEDFRYEQERSSELMLGRSKSYLWLAKGPQWYPMIAEGDLGEWDRKKTFWKKTDPLQRVNGLIDVMHNHWFGTILLGGRVTARFVPNRGEFLPDSDQGQPVNFFLGLSPEGLQAWEVQRGHRPDAVSASDVIPRKPVPAHAVEPAAERDQVPTEVMATRVAQVQDDQKLAFCLALLQAWQEVDQTPRLSMLSERVGARYRYDGTDVEALLERSDQVYFIGHGDDPEIRLAVPGGRGPTPQRTGRPAAKGGPAVRPGRKVPAQVLQVYEAKRTVFVDCGEGQYANLGFEDIVNPVGAIPTERQLLWMERELDRRGGVLGRLAELLPLTATLVGDELVSETELPERVESDLRDELERRVAGGDQRVPETELVEFLEGRFKGASPLAERLGLDGLPRLWRELDWLRVERGGSSTYLRLATRPVFGRTHLPRPADPPSVASIGTTRPVFGRSLSSAVDALSAGSGGADPEFGAVLEGLRSSLGEDFDTVVGPEGGTSLRARILGEPGWELVGRPLRPELVRRKRGGPSAKTMDVPKRQGPSPVVNEPGDVRQKRPGEAYDTVVARPVPAPAPTSEAVDVLDIAADIEEAVAELAAQGADATLPAIGDFLSKRWGMDQYRKITAQRKLRSLAEQHGWLIEEVRPGLFGLWRPSGVATEGG
ncbi:hypothetical protein [Streptomyces sp. NPDC088196]|uniref:P-loop NTPase n=1 Tax=Streptomyces sp. NPDC088196 TaxID=3154868 RepID=UPI00344B703B